MPSGKTHFAFELVLWPLFLAGYDWFLQPTTTELTLFTGAYIFSSLLLSPDLDLYRNRARRRWGPLGFIWTPYAKLFKHRGLSHSLLFGTMTRLLYLTLLFSLVAVGLAYAGLALPGKLQIEPRLLLIAYAGLALPNLLHVLLDRLVSAFK